MAIKLLLIEDVDDLGRSGDLVKVKNGFARNFLLPQRKGLIADKGALRMQDRLQEERLKRAVEEKKDSDAMAAKLDGSTVTTVVKVDHEGHMYGSVSALDIVDLVKEQCNIELQKKFIPLKHPLKTTGTHPIELKLNEGVTAKITLIIEPEGGFKVVEAPRPAQEASE